MIDNSVPASPMPMLVAIVLTYNEEIHIARCLKSIRSFCDEIFVIDSFSTDRTVEIARSYGAQVLEHTYVNQAMQFQWALDNIDTTATWLFRLDADEVVEEDLAVEIRTKLAFLPEEVVGIHLNRKHIFLGRWIKYGGRYPLYLLRIWRRGKGGIEKSWMDEHIVVWGGSTVNFEGGFCDHSLRDITFFTDKHNQYASREAVQVFARRRGLLDVEDGVGLVGQAARKRIVKQSLYEKLPFPFGPVLYFLFRYIVQFGFLDGVEGLIYHFLQGLWYRFLVGAKLIELERIIPHGAEADTIRQEIARLTGLKLPSN